MKQAMLGAIFDPIRSIGSDKKMRGVAVLMSKDMELPYIKELTGESKIKPFIDHTYSMDEIPEAPKLYVGFTACVWREWVLTRLLRR